MNKIFVFIVLLFSFKSTVFSQKYRHDFSIEYGKDGYYLIINEKDSLLLPNEVFRMRSWLDGIIYKDRASLNVDKFREWFEKFFMGYYCYSVINLKRSNISYKKNGSSALRMFTRYFTVIYSDIPEKK